jgi:glycogen operon protein
LPGRKWFRAIDTNQSSPLDIADPGAEAPVAGNTQTVSGRSIVVLVNR